MGRAAAYEWRNGDQDFATAWAEALDAYADALEAEADRRAVKGIDKPIYYEGRRIDTIKQYSDTLLIFRLKALRPDKYRERFQGEIGGSGGQPIEFTVKLVRAKDGNG